MNKFTNILTMARKMKSHKCKNKHFAIDDSVIDGEVCVGYKCCCGEIFLINIEDINVDELDCNDIAKDLLKTCFNNEKGRSVFAESCI